MTNRVIEDEMEEEDVEFDLPNAADAGRINERVARVKKDEERAVEFWQACLSDPIGRKEIWNLLQTAGTFENRFSVGPNGFPQVEATWFNAGQAAFGLQLYHSLLVRDHQAVYNMHLENDPRFTRIKPKRRRLNND